MNRRAERRRLEAEARGEKPASSNRLMRFISYLQATRDPFVLAVFLEDMAACSGVLLAATGIGLTYATGNPMWDAGASVAIGAMLGGVAIKLARTNQRYLLGHAIEPGE